MNVIESQSRLDIAECIEIGFLKLEALTDTALSATNDYRKTAEGIEGVTNVKPTMSAR